jgi:heptose-I-phosphate ethanolaminephosphotransferase
MYIDNAPPQFFNIFISYAFFLALAVSALALPGFTIFNFVLLCLALTLPLAVSSSYMAIYREPIDGEAFYFLWETNILEASEFALNAAGASKSALPLAIFSLLLPMPFGAFILSRRRILKKIKTRYRVGISAFCLAFVMFALNFGGIGFNVVCRFYYTFADYRASVRKVMSIKAGVAQNIASVEVKSARPADAQETYVVVIGESASRHHMSLYGYPRVTDPRMAGLDSRGELLAFRNVSSAFMATTQSLLRAFSLMDQFSPPENFDYSVVDIFNRAGFKTFWLSNNAVMPQHDTLLEAIWGNAAVKKFTDPQNSDILSMGRGRISANKTDEEGKKDITFDGALMEWFDEAIRDGANKKIIFVHLKGSHLMYWYRYPGSFEKFKAPFAEAPMAESMSKEDFDTLNDYDNSICYTDHILGELTELLRVAGESWLLYFSDHGEEVFDFRVKYGRDTSNPSKYMFEVPFILWLSEEYKKSRDTELFSDYLERPYQLDNLIHTIMDLARLETDILDPARSAVTQ